MSRKNLLLGIGLCSVLCCLIDAAKANEGLQTIADERVELWQFEPTSLGSSILLLDELSIVPTPSIELAHTGSSFTSVINIEFSGTIALESRWFWDSTTLGPISRDAGLSYGVVVMPEMDTELGENTSLRFAGFYRNDELDSERTHGDVREAYLVHYRPTPFGELELRVGLDRVFWGVAESNHLIDIVNQTDLVENPNEEVKLGQPMIHLTLSTNSGIFELFGLPVHRQRTFPGPTGRLGFPILINTDNILYESNNEDRNFDVAIRYSHTFGSLDIGFSGFWGTNREPFFVPYAVPNQPMLFSPFYTQISQTAIDLRYQHSGWLLKFEGLHRAGAFNRLGATEDYSAFVGGSEYSIFSLFGTRADMTLVAEWSVDKRRERATTRFDNDLFLASRLALNDFQGTMFTLSFLLGNDNDSMISALELSRRISDSMSLAMELVHFNQIAADDVLYSIQNDSYLELSIKYGF